ncbi:MAG: Gfo/Idh/MocA family oxidoreductase [Chloroflexi bacterium]|nr:Gfo/Idh/MocA family oxidoreductase [Chloroflexota bacterium]
MTTSKTVRIGYIGAGNFSQRRLIPQLKRIPGVELVVIANSTPESSRKVADAFGFSRIAEDWHGVVEATDIDAIVVGTRTAMHPEMCVPVLEAGKHLLTMNAIAGDLQGAQAMLRAAQTHPNLAALVYPGQFYLREEAMMQRLLRDGYVGKVLHVFTYWYSRFFGLGSQFEIANRWFGPHSKVFGYRRGFELPPPGTDQQARDVRPESNVVLGEMESGAAITYIHSTVGGDSALWRFEVYGDQGSIVCYPSGQAAGFPGQVKTGFFGAKTADKELQPLPVPDELKDPSGELRSVAVEAEFIATVRSEREPARAVPRFLDGVRLLEFADAWRKSAEAGAWVEVPQEARV